MLIHTVSDILYESYRDDQQSDDPEENSPTTLQMEIFQNQIFYRFDGILELLSRTYLLWTRYSGRVARTPIAYKVNEILFTATGLDIADWVICGYYLILLNQESRTTRVWFTQDILPFASDGRFGHFLSLLSKELGRFRQLLNRAHYRWSYETFEDYPLVRNDNVYAIIDSIYLIERVTNGLYWYVHDYIRDTGDSGDLTRWTQAYAEMIEYYAIDLVLEMAPHGLGGAKVIYSEEELSSLFNCKVCETVIDYGSIFCAVEVVSGRVKRPARLGGDIDAFHADTERLVMNKVRQLHEISLALIQKESVLTKAPPVSGRVIYPILVSDYPFNPLVRRDLRQRTVNEGLLSDVRIARLSIIDVGELEQLESILSTGGPSLPTLLRDWHNSSLAGGPLLAYLYTEYGSGEERKTLSMREVDITEIAKKTFAETEGPTN